MCRNHSTVKNQTVCIVFKYGMFPRSCKYIRIIYCSHHPEDATRVVERCLWTLCNTITFMEAKGTRGGVVVKAIRYKPAGRGFDSRWCHWNFSVT